MAKTDINALEAISAELGNAHIPSSPEEFRAVEAIIDDAVAEIKKLRKRVAEHQKKYTECVNNCDDRVEKIDREYKDSMARYTEGYMKEILELRAENTRLKDENYYLNIAAYWKDGI